ncbi:MAG: hypothetical protein NDF55_07750 [archaeon GB-1867-005]|nr:hypothetical protein [Candidatus Culexmicrobium cathedralense]
MSKLKLKYKSATDEEVVEEMRRRLNEIKMLLIEIRDLLKTAVGLHSG